MHSPTSQLRAQLDEAPLTTERLFLRLPRAADAEALYHGYATDEMAIRWMGFRPHTSLAVTEKLIAGWIAAWDRGEGMLAFMITDRVSGQFLGVADLTIGPHGALLGYILCRFAWGRGVASEAARRLVDLAFEHFAIWRVWATCAPQNPASRRVLEKAGMRHEGVLRRWIVSPLVSSEPRDSDCLAITRDDWLSHRRGGAWSGDVEPSTVFLVHHVHEFENGSEDVKLIGVYTSQADAEAAVARVRDQPGFRDHTAGFDISEIRVGEDHWTEGFISWDEASGPDQSRLDDDLAT